MGMEASRSCAGDPSEELSMLQVSLPESTPPEVVEAIVDRLRLAERHEKEEIFTGCRIVQNSRVTPGMAAVTRPRRGGGCPHVFIYDLTSIRIWQCERGI